jgi:hypothetical protein
LHPPDFGCFKGKSIDLAPIMTSDGFSPKVPPIIAGPTVSAGSLKILVWLVACLGAPLLLLRSSPSTKPDDASVDREDVPRRIADLQAAQPDYIGIGNSMMFTRLGKTPQSISTLTGKRFHFLYRGGSDSLIWYLMLKNIVVPSGVRPKAIFLFVRDNELTTPYFGTDAQTSPYISSLRSAQEPELDRYVAPPSSGPTDQPGMIRSLSRLYSFPDWRESMSRRLTNAAMDVGGLGAPKKAQRFVLSARFDLDHLRADVPVDLPKVDRMTLMPGGYEAATEASLLPAMIQLANECGAKLLVFRIKRRPDAATHLPEEPAAMRDYAKFLGEWLEARGGLFFDETYDPSIQLSDYLDGDHIRPDRLSWYQGSFWQRTREVFP